MDYGQCVSEETLTDYLEGTLDPVMKAASEAHFIGCDQCRRRLAFFMKLLSAEATVEESAALACIQQQWDSGSSSRKLPGRAAGRRSLSLVFTGIAASLIAGIVLMGYILERGAPASATRIVDLLLESQQRPFEARLAGQPYQRMVRTRGLTAPGVAYGPLAGEMTRLSASSHQMGRFYLLQKDFTRALSYLEIAEQEVGAGAAVHNDLGVAYLEDAGDLDQLEKAAEEFRHALAADPEFAAAAFNLAILYERTGNPSEAERQWRRYLQLEPASLWAVEARSKLEEANTD